ncbi:hypothetical protein BDY19DRAFT_910704 [Irpex rosettiformis]|uniref:Uncharacterized protein n=1 Tax=Irpex rosettiformis TaxID=378272 RepID=A0ACB8TMS4_9APHY|nr:hypothetical protein BDY19DRAFT_910704 [Irpex rosettiformis]
MDKGLPTHSTGTPPRFGRHSRPIWRLVALALVVVAGVQWTYLSQSQPDRPAVRVPLHAAEIFERCQQLSVKPGPPQMRDGCWSSVGVVMVVVVVLIVFEGERKHQAAMAKTVAQQRRVKDMCGEGLDQASGGGRDERVEGVYQAGGGGRDEMVGRERTESAGEERVGSERIGMARVIKTSGSSQRGRSRREGGEKLFSSCGLQSDQNIGGGEHRDRDSAYLLPLVERELYFLLQVITRKAFDKRCHGFRFVAPNVNFVGYQDAIRHLPPPPSPSTVAGPLPLVNTTCPPPSLFVVHSCSVVVGHMSLPPDAVLPSVYPVAVASNSPVLRGLVPCTLYDSNRRSTQLPMLYEYPFPHPSHRVKLPGSRTYVYLVDPSPEGKAIADALMMAQVVPSGSEKDIPWLLDVRPGDAILARPIDRAGDPEYDALQALCGIALERTESPDMKQLLEGSKYTIADVVARIDAYEEARDALLGSRVLRVKNKGKAAFEMDPRAEPVSNGPRCYPFNSMVQRTRQVEGPPATLKTVYNTPDEYQHKIQAYNNASTALNVLAWELQGPLHQLKATREFSDHINTPRLGHHDNFYWFPQQNNVAKHKFTNDQGFFSGVHKDNGDAVNGHSVGLVGSDLPAIAEPGRFHLVGLGVYFRLTYMAQVFFTGLLPHGGTAPLIPEEVEIEGWETRMFLISYPASSMLNGEARHPCASLPYEEFPLHIPPEATGAPHNTREQPFWTNHATYAQDGWVCTDARGLINFLVRAFIQLLFWILKQVPAEYGVQVDCDLITSSVTYLQDGNRVSADRWEFAPNADVQNPFGDVHKNIQDAFLKREYDRLLQGIPGVVTNKYRDWDVTTSSFGGRPKGM